MSVSPQATSLPHQVFLKQAGAAGRALPDHQTSMKQNKIIHLEI
jgi:hypothetical protein